MSKKPDTYIATADFTHGNGTYAKGEEVPAGTTLQTVLRIASHLVKAKPASGGSGS